MSILVLLLLTGSVKHVLNIRFFNHVVQELRAHTLELDGSRRLIAIEYGPFASQSIITLEHRSIKLNQGFGDNRLVFSLSSLNTHHSRKWASSGDPLSRITLTKILDARHVTRLLDHHKVSSVLTNSVAVLRVKVGG